ncbi:hypothetical protein NDU88_000778 [Pleurodeles waltl]|uniref:Secreted protein n=1 Tax=Pleurodeles waltl TaxID=8319 RepID=A0AAV7L7M3_PLEWA|nr:hypothetical protein NDU88_000778 [Pleurodeles waltl]
MGCGITRCPRVCAWILRLVFRLCVVPGSCAWNFLPHGRRRVDFLLGRLAALSMRGRALKFRSHRRRDGERRLSGSACGDFLTAEQAVRRNFRRTRSPNEKEKSFFVLRLQGTGGKLYPSPWRALLQPDKSSARQQANSKAAVLCRQADR